MVSRFYGQVRQKYEKNYYREQKEKSKVDFQPYSHFVAALRYKSNLYPSFRAIVDCYEFIKSRQPELILENVSVVRWKFYIKIQL